MGHQKVPWESMNIITPHLGRLADYPHMEWQPWTSPVVTSINYRLQVHNTVIVLRWHSTNTTSSTCTVGCIPCNYTIPFLGVAEGAPILFSDLGFYMASCSYIYICMYVYIYIPLTTTTQCKLTEWKYSACASGWMKKHHQRKLQLVTPTTCPSGMIAPVERRETPQAQGAQVRMQGAKVRTQGPKVRASQ